MVVICQVRAQSRVLKKWYGCSVAEQVTLTDCTIKYASGQLDNSEAIPAEFETSRVACSLGRKKREMVMVSPDVAVGEASAICTYSYLYSCVPPTLCPYGTNCLRTFTTVSPFLLLNPLLTSGNRTPGSRFYSGLLDTSVCLQLVLKRRVRLRVIVGG